MSKRFSIGLEPQIKIESVEGDLRIVGWETDEILVRSDEEAVTYQQNGDGISISCQDDLTLNVPKKSRIHIQTVIGDASVRGVEGDLNTALLNGDVDIRNAGKVTIDAVEADFSLRGAQGDVHIKSVGGDASLRDINGQLTLDSVSDDLAIRGVGGNLKVDVDSDVVVHLEPKSGQEYSIIAGENILLILPTETNATLSISADTIKMDWPDIRQEESTSRVVTLGDGSAQIKLDAGGDVLVTNRKDASASADEHGNFAGMMFDWGSWGREIGQEWENIGRDWGDHISRQAQETAQRVERKMRHAASRRNARMKWTWDFDNMPKAPKREPVSEEERMAILRMLAEKKITSEEADQLLSALEGEQ